MQEWLEFTISNSSKLLEQTGEHLMLTILSVCLATIIGLPLGIWISARKNLSTVVLQFAGILQTIPSIALLGFMIPLLGIGVYPAIVALFLYSLLPIIRNTYTGINEVDVNVIEAAKGMGMSNGQIIRNVSLPLALPTIFAGIRTATVINVGVATLAAYIAAGGLGEFIFGGIALNNSSMILAGAVPAALLAVLLDGLLSLLQKRSRGKRSRKSIVGMFLFLTVLSIAWSAQPSPPLEAGFTPEFMGRKDGYPLLQKAYQLKIPTVVLGPALMYEAIKAKKVDVISGYATDGRIKAYELTILKDDQAALPNYFAAPLVRKEALALHPQLDSVLSLLSGKINDSIITSLNYQMDIEQQPPEKVAANFLASIDLLKAPQKGKKTLVIGSKIFSEQYILVAIYQQLIEGHLPIKVDSKTGLGGTKICFDALVNGEIDFYPEYTGTGIQVLLETPDSIALPLYKDLAAQQSYLEQVFEEKYQLQWFPPLGFNNAYALMMRSKDAQTKGIESISQLSRYLVNEGK